MDQLTKKIILILRRHGRISFSDIARELNVTRDQVASRVNPLFESAELRVIAAPHPRVLGLTVSAHISIKVSGDIQPIIEKLNTEMKRVMALPGMGDRLAAIELMATTPEELTAYMKKETDRWGALIRQLGLKAE